MPVLPEADHGSEPLTPFGVLSGYHQEMYDRAGEIGRQTLPALNEGLKQLITLSAALIGGGFVVAKGDVVAFWWGVAVLAVLVVSLGSALWGVLPTGGTLDRSTLGGLEAVAAFDERVRNKKSWAVRVSAVALVLAFTLGVIGVAVKGPPAPPPAPAG